MDSAEATGSRLRVVHYFPLTDASKGITPLIPVTYERKDPRRLWQGFQNLTDYKPLPLRTCHSDPSLPDELNDFYARFEVNSIIPAQTLPPSPTDQVLQVSTAEVKRVLASVNPRKAAGPDNIPGRVLKDCAEQLSDVFTDIFNTSLSQAAVPTCLKSATIIPVPKKSKPACLNDFRPVALTPIIMKCFERLVMRHIKNCLPANLDPLQFAYRTNRSTEDAIATTLHLTLSHLERKNTYARILLIDFSSAFNTLIPQQLVEKLKMLQVDTGICNWILDFLTQRRQAVKVGSQTSRTISVSTGSPQGCVLSPLLFSLLTHDCAARHSTNTSSSTPTTQQWWGSSVTMMSLRTGSRWSCSLHGVNPTTLSSMWTKQRRWWLTFGGVADNMHQ